MTSSLEFQKKAVILAIVLPVAAVLGFLLATPGELTSLAGVAVVLAVLAIPIMLRWHYPILVFSWNAAIIVVVLPGNPDLWMLMGCVSFFFTFLASILNREQKLQQVPALTWTLGILGLVVLATAYFTGGIGVRSLGGTKYGGKNYFYILFAIIGYFALSFHRIPLAKAHKYATLFLASGLTLAMGNLAYLGGESFFWLFNIFPIDYVVNQASEDFLGPAGALKFGRLSGFSWAGLAVFSILLIRYGLRGILDLSRPWRMGLSLVLFAVSLLGGFRSIIVIYAFLILAQFYFERLYRVRMMVPTLVISAVLAMVLIVPFAEKLPLSVQRSLSILPIEVHPAAKADAEASTDWRLRMWKVLLPEIPQYFWLGKGFTANATDHWLALESFKRGLSEDIEISLIAGDYHNGPISVLLPFGIWGMLAFLAFIITALKVLYHNYRHGHPQLRLINTFLLSYFVARLAFFLLIFGAFNSDLWLFVGLTAMSVALNGGLARKSNGQETGPAESRAGEGPAAEAPPEPHPV